MGGRSGQSINNVGSGATSNVSINAPNLSKELQDYSLTIAKKYGLKGEIEISVQKSNKVGGFVNTDFIEGKGIDTKIYMNPNKMTILSPSLTSKELGAKEVIRHELKHIQQAQEKKFYIAYDKTMKKPIKKIYFDGKAVVSLSQFQKIMKFKTKSDYEAYKNFPWEKEAYATANDD